jgi:hypothetical protein
MKKRLLYLSTFVFLMLCVSAIKAATITIINGEPSSEIYLNNRLVGQGELENYFVSEGSYQLKVYDDNVKTFSSFLDLNENENKFIDLNQYNSYRPTRNKKKVKSTLSIFTENADSEIFINNQRIARGSISDYQVKPGTYMVDVFDGPIKTFSTIADIKKHESKVFKINNPAPLTTANDDQKLQPIETNSYNSSPSLLSLKSSKLNIFTDETDSKIYIDGVLIGNGSIVDFLVSKGSHKVTIYHDNLKVYSTLVDVPENETVAVDATRFVDYQSSMPDIGAKTQELKRMKASRGNIGLGITAGHTSGINLKYYLNERFGLQGTFIGADTGTDNFNNWNAKAIFIIKDNIINDKPATLYFTTGFGEQNENNDEVEKNIGSFEANLGIEIPMSAWFKNTRKRSILGSIAKGLLSSDNAYFNLEVGYLRALGNTTEKETYYSDTTTTTTDYSGVGIRAGISYFF